MTHIILCTVPHTGTNFFHKMFRDAGFVTLGAFATKEKIAQDSGGLGWVTRMHISHDAVKYCLERQRYGAVIVTTYRDPIALKDSWKARKRDAKENLNVALGHQDRLVGLAKPYVLTFEPSLARDEKLHTLSKHLGVPLSVDWDDKIGARKR